MAFRYKLDIMQALKDKGYSSYKLRKEKIFGEKTMTDFRKNKVTWSEDCFEKLYNILGLEVHELIEHYTDPNNDRPETKN